VGCEVGLLKVYWSREKGEFEEEKVGGLSGLIEALPTNQPVGKSRRYGKEMVWWEVPETPSCVLRADAAILDAKRGVVRHK
jgi:hypothetical protein